MVSIGAGYTARKEGRVLCVKNEENVESCTKLVEKNRQEPGISANGLKNDFLSPGSLRIGQK